ncbi:SDR family NAD(P)-dependent oxidoreductase [Mycobacteroides abscessus]
MLITGATGGLGLCIVRKFVDNGAEVIITGRRKEILEELSNATGAGLLVADLADRSDVTRLFNEAGPVDIFVANAGVPGTGLLASVPLSEVDLVLEVNLRAAIVSARAVMNEMINKQNGHIVFMSSMAGKFSSPRTSLYNATKFGLRGFSQALRQELAPHGVGVSAVYPGFVREAGMFASTGVRLPRGVGTVSPQQVADATFRAIERNIGEIDVAPLLMRSSALLSAWAPEVFARMQRTLGADKISAEIDSNQRRAANI